MEDPLPRTFDGVFNDFKGRRTGLIRALTTDVMEFYERCDPEKDHLCLYGLPDETWEVNPPAEEVPSELPEPALGINFARDGMQDKDWLALVAVHGDSWLLSVAFYFGARIGFGKNERNRLFGLINDLPSIYEIVAGIPQQPKEQSGAHNSESKSGGKTSRSEPQTERVKTNAPPKEEDDSGEERDAEEEDDEQGTTICGACGGSYASDEFWICCDMCEIWFHGKCVKITPAKAEHIKQYKCPTCSNKMAQV